MTSPFHPINRGGAGEIETFAMANCLMLLSSQQAQSGPNLGGPDPARMFSCKTCGRKFPSFQALGGHRASHNKHKPLSGAAEGTTQPAPPKSHACTICGLEFPIGQALGGHMRRHRAALSSAAAAGSTVTSEGSVDKSGNGFSMSGDDVSAKKRKIVEADVAVMKKLNSGKRVYLGLDLNFPPWEHASEEVNHDHHDEIEEGEIVEQEEEHKHGEEQSDFLKLELGLPVH